MTPLDAGQGYIWLAHRQPGTPGWAIAKRSKHLWECMLKTGLDCQDSSTHVSLGTKEDVEWQVKYGQCSSSLHPCKAGVLQT